MGKLVLRDPSPFLDLSKNLLVRWPEVGPSCDVRGQGFHRLLGLEAVRFVSRRPGINLVGPPIDLDEERIRMGRNDSQQRQQASGEHASRGGKAGHGRLRSEGNRLAYYTPSLAKQERGSAENRQGSHQIAKPLRRFFLVPFSP